MTETMIANTWDAACGLIIVLLSVSFGMAMYLFFADSLFNLSKHFPFFKRMYDYWYGDFYADEVMNNIAKGAVILGTIDIVVPILVLCTYTYLTDTTILEMWNQIEWGAVK